MSSIMEPIGTNATELSYRAVSTATMAPKVESTRPEPIGGDQTRVYDDRELARSALAIAMAWLRKGLESQNQIATAYMRDHAVIIRWTTALLVLTEALDPERVAVNLPMAACIFN